MQGAHGIIGTFRVLRAAMALGAVLVLALPWRIWPASGLARLGWALLLRGFDVRLRVHGVPAQAGTLLLVNHVSWIDIAVLARLVDAGFVAKAEVGHWPVIGGLARRWGCLFVDRTQRRMLGGKAAAIERHLASGRSLVLFPEGTTGAGEDVLPFRSSLLGGGGDLLLRVQPVTLAYCCAADRARAAWLGDAALLPHALELARGGGVTIDVWFEEPFIGMDRKAVAACAEAAVARRLAAVLDVQAATLNRAA